jgi:hypothetical protein
VRELEEKRINKEMAHIRQKFKGEPLCRSYASANGADRGRMFIVADGNLDGRQKKK